MNNAEGEDRPAGNRYGGMSQTAVRGCRFAPCKERSKPCWQGVGKRKAQRACLAEPSFLTYEFAAMSPDTPSFWGNEENIILALGIWLHRDGLLHRDDEAVDGPMLDLGEHPGQ